MKSSAYFKFLIFFLFFYDLPFLSLAQDAIEVKSDIAKVTVFIKGAQVTRTKTVEVKPGKTVYKFIDLSPYIDPATIQVKASGQVMVLSVNHQTNHLDSLKKSQELEDLTARSLQLEEKINIENVNLQLIEEDLAFLLENRTIVGKNEQLKLELFKATADYYRERNAALRMKKVGVLAGIQELNKLRNKILLQSQQLTAGKTNYKGEVVVKLSSEINTACQFELTYMVANAGWYPSYDVRTENIDVPMKLVYKANVHQDTKEDWKDIKLNLSSSDPHHGMQAPYLKTYFLNYSLAPPVYSKVQGNISGVVLDASSSEPVIGAVVSVRGTSIATTTDINGRYNLTLPQNNNNIVISYAGYQELNRVASSKFMQSYLQEDTQPLQEVVVIGYGTQEKEDVSAAIQGRAAGVNAEPSKKTSYKNNLPSSIKIPVEEIQAKTSFEFQINTPYTILSNNKSISVDMNTYALTTTYDYRTVPKIEKEAFLIANVTDWQKYNLLQGEANIFYENTFVGKTLIDPGNISDTLQLSLGRDKNVVIKREKISDFTKRQFLGSKQEETRAWKISIKNNKSLPVHLMVSDQVPVSTLEEIEVTTEELSGGVFNKETGEIKWIIDLPASSQKEIILRYSTKYPKSRKLFIE